MLIFKDVLNKMCCCKACQYYLETIYWHCFEKHFCYDMNIALYEDDDTTKSTKLDGPSVIHDQNQSTPKSDPCNSFANNHQPATIRSQSSKHNVFDNMAFYDNVAILAKRSIFIIDPKDAKSYNGSDEEEKKHWDDEDDDISVITEQPRFSMGTLDNSSYKSESDLSMVSSNNLSYNTKSEPNLVQFVHQKEVPIICNTNATVSLSSLATINEEINDSAPKIDVNRLAPVTSMSRKKSLHERRVSRSLTLDIDKRQELPITRQSSFPKFYIDTPDPLHQAGSCIATNTIQALETPIQPSIFQYDLKSIVKIEDERRENQMLHKQVIRSASAKENKLLQFRDKLKPIKLLRNASSQSLQSQNFSTFN